MEQLDFFSPDLQRTTHSAQRKLTIYSLTFLLLFCFLPTKNYAQSNKGLPPANSCSNPVAISPDIALQDIQVDLTGLSSYYISFDSPDTVLYLSVYTGEYYPMKVKLYEVDCNGAVVMVSNVQSDSANVQSLELYSTNLTKNDSYMIEVVQNSQNSATTMDISYFMPPIIEPPVEPCCNTAPVCGDIMFNGSFEEDLIGNKTNQTLNHGIHLSRGYLPVINGSNQGDYFSPKGNANYSPFDSKLGNNIYPVNTPSGNDSYAGIFAVYTSLINHPTTGDHREWICGQLQWPMENGKRYLVGMSVHLSDDALFGYGSVPPGIRLSDQPTSNNSQADIINMTADIQPSNVITTSTNWIRVEGIYTANGNEHFVTVANFLTNSQSINNFPTFNRSYFFIDNITVTPIGVCCALFDIPDGWNTNSLLNSPSFAPYVTGTTLQNVDVNVHGTFTIDNNLTLKNVNFNMDANSKINVINGSTLTIDNSKLKVCGDTMWDGIEVVNANSKVIMKNNSEIWYAKKGILSTNGGNFDVNHSFFNANNYGIYVDTYSGVHHGKVRGTDFEANVSLLYPLQNNPTVYAGIYLNDVANPTNSLLIGDKNADANEFNTFHNSPSVGGGIQYGIYAKSSDFKVVNSVFENFIRFSGQGGTPENTAIKVIGLPYGSYYTGYCPTAEIGDMSLTASNQNKFYLTSSAVSVDGIQNVVIKNNKIDWVNNIYGLYINQYTIDIQNNSWSATKCIVENNSIQGIVNGIRLENIQELTTISISNNSIELLNLAGNTGIRLNQLLPTNLITYQINNNTISKTTRGIEVNSSVIPEISSNSINLNTTITGSIPNYGILVNSSSLFSQYFPTIENNQILGDATTSNTDVNGISVITFGENLPILCNDIQKTGTAIYMNSVNSYANYYDVFGNVMDYNYNCFVIDNNTQLGDIGNYGAPSNNLFYYNNFNLHTYAIGSSAANLFVHGTALPTYPTYNINMSIIITSPGGFDCGGGGEGAGKSSQSAYLHLPQKGIDSLPDFKNNYTSDTLRWLAEYQYYQLLLNDSIADKSVQQYKDSVDKAALGKLLGIEQQILSPNKNNAAVSLTNVTTSISQESLLKTVLTQQQLAKSQKWDSVPTAAKAILIPIAKACSFEAGPAVTKARAILYSYAGKRFHNKCESYTSSLVKKNRLKNAAETAQEANEVTVYPNPAKDNLTVEIKLDKEETANFKVYDLKGRLLLEQGLNKNKNSLSLKGLANGIYIYWIKNQNGKILKTDKLIIQ